MTDADKSKKFFASFCDHPDWAAAGASPPAGSKLRPLSFWVQYFPDRAESVKMSFDMITGEVRAIGTNAKILVRLKQALTALTPHLLELKEVWRAMSDELVAREAGTPSQMDDVQMGHQSFLATWMYQRCIDVFDAIIDLPLDKMEQAVKAFKPTSSQSFAADIEINANIIRLIPAEDLTPEICSRAVRKTSTALMHVPLEMRTPALCLEAMQVKHSLGGYALQYVPLKFRTKELCREAVLSTGYNIQFVPQSELNQELCALACLRDGLAWDLIPKDQRTLEVEYCASLHRLMERDPGQVYGDLQAADAQNAQAIADKYEKLFVEINFPNADASDLEDMGWPRELAGA